MIAKPAMPRSEGATATLVDGFRRQWRMLDGVQRQSRPCSIRSRDISAMRVASASVARRMA
jgi:hypothetical protein